MEATKLRSLLHTLIEQLNYPNLGNIDIRPASVDTHLLNYKSQTTKLRYIIMYMFTKLWLKRINDNY